MRMSNILYSGKASLRFFVCLSALCCLLSACSSGPFSQTPTYSIATPNVTSGPPSPAPTIVLPDEGVAANIPVSANPNIFVASGNAKQLTFIGTDTKSIATNLYAMDYLKEGNTTIVNFGQSLSQPLEIMIPRGANLTVKMNNGNVTVDSLQGQVSITLVSGTIQLKNFTPHGTGTIETKSGTIDVTFAKNASCNLTAQTNFGTIVSNYPAISQKRTGTKVEAAGMISNSSRTTVNLKVTYGSITLSPV